MTDPTRSADRSARSRPPAARVMGWGALLALANWGCDGGERAREIAVDGQPLVVDVAPCLGGPVVDHPAVPSTCGERLRAAAGVCLVVSLDGLVRGHAGVWRPDEMRFDGPTPVAEAGEEVEAALFFFAHRVDAARCRDLRPRSPCDEGCLLRLDSPRQAAPADGPLRFVDDDGRCASAGAPANPCDAVDDDCDRVADEGAALGAACSGTNPTCRLMCDPAGPVCTSPDQAARERCETVGIDDDCDGRLDEGCASPDPPCPVGDPGCPPAAHDDRDDDGVPDRRDICPDVPDRAQSDQDGDGIGDACDDDIDGDGLDAEAERAVGGDPRDPDTDADGVADADDLCPAVADPNPRDLDGDGAGDACDADDDGDGVLDVFDPCPWLADEASADACADDRDGDGVAGEADRCPWVAGRVAPPCDGPFGAWTWSRVINRVRADGDGLLVATDGGLLQVHAEGEVVARWTTAEGLAGNRITGFDSGEDGSIWVASDRGLSVIRPNGLVLTAVEDRRLGRVDDVAVSGPVVRFVADGVLWALDRRAPTDLALRLLAPARAIFVDNAGALWRIDDAGAHRVDSPFSIASGALGVGRFTGGRAGADGLSIWLYGPAGAVQASEATGAVLRIIPGPAVRDVVSVDQTAFLATELGLRRAEGELLLPAPPAASPLAAPLSTLEAGPRGSLWAGTGDGLYRAEPRVASYSHLDRRLSCTRTVAETPFGLWAGTAQGPVALTGPGLFQAGIADDVAGIVAHDQTAFVAAGERVHRLLDPRVPGPPDGRPVDGAVPSALLGDERSERLWVGLRNHGLAWTDWGFDWRPLRAPVDAAPDAPRLLEDRVLGLSLGPRAVWIAHPSGVSAVRRRVGPETAFEVPWTFDHPVRAVLATPAEVWVATAGGLYVGGLDRPWVQLTRENGGLPGDAGTDGVAALAALHDQLWLAFDPSDAHPQGRLGRRPIDPLALDGLASVAPGDLGIDGWPAGHTVGLFATGGEMLVATCGADGAPEGGLVAVSGLEALRAVRFGLVGGGPETRLTGGLDGHPLALAAGPRGPIGERVTPAALTPVPLPEEPHWLPRACAATADRLWCGIDDFGALVRSDGVWNTRRLVDIGETLTVRSALAVDVGQVWLATDRGLGVLGGGAGRLLSGAELGLERDDILALATWAEDLVLATPAGVARADFDGALRLLIEPERLPSVSIRALAADGERLWVATDRGLAAYDRDGQRVPLPTLDRLARVAIADVALRDGRVYAATDRGLFRFEPGRGERRFGLRDGVPGRAVHQVRVAHGGRLWIRADDGVAWLDP